MSIKRGDVGGTGDGTLNTIDQIVAQVAAEIRLKSAEAKIDANRAEAAAVDALEYRDQAEQFKNQAENRATMADQAAMSALDSSIQADISRAAAETQANEAAASAVDAEGFALQAADEANLALQYKNDAAQEADRAELEADRAEYYADGIESAAVPLFFVAWCPDRNHIWSGYVAADGQQLSSATYPDAAAGIAAGTVPTTDDATWLADPTQRGKYVADDGSGYFRIPDYNGRYSGSLGAVYQTGDGHKSAGEAGVIREDQMQGHRHATAVLDGNEANAVQGEGDSVSRLGVGTIQLAARNLVLTGPAAYSDTLGGEPRTGDHTHGTDVTGCWVIRLFGEVVNVGSADAEQLASDFANLNGAFQALDSQIDFAIVYPGGGDASSPGEVERNSLYEVASPFPGHYLILHPELFYNGKWVTISPGLAATGSRQSAGVLAGQDGDSILVRTGTGWLIADNGSNLSTAEAPTSAIGPLPCRVKVWKSKGVF